MEGNISGSSSFRSSVCGDEDEDDEVLENFPWLADRKEEWPDAKRYLIERERCYFDELSEEVETLEARAGRFHRNFNQEKQRFEDIVQRCRSEMQKAINENDADEESFFKPIQLKYLLGARLYKRLTSMKKKLDETEELLIQKTRELNRFYKNSLAIFRNAVPEPVSEEFILDLQSSRKCDLPF